MPTISDKKMITPLSTFRCSHNRNHTYDAVREHPLRICEQCEAKYYFDTMFQEFTDFIYYEFISGVELL